MPSPAATRPGLKVRVSEVVAIAASALVALALAAAPALLQPGDDPLRPLTQLLAIAGLALTTMGLVAKAPSWAMAAAGCFAAELVSTLFERDARIDGWTPLTAAGLLLLCELVAWSAELRDGGVVLPRGDAPRALPKPAVIAVTAVFAWLAATVLAGLAAAVAPGRDLVIAALGAAAVGGVVVSLVASVNRQA